MGREEFGVGDIVFSRVSIENDGCVPGVAADALLARPGVRGVVVNFGHAELDEREEIYLVRFEDGAGDLGPPVGCLPEELTQDEVEAKALLEAGS
jgi:nitrogen fixation protein NifZ